MSDTVQYTIEIPADVHEQLSNTAQKSGLKVEDLIISSAEMVYAKPSQGIMKRVIRLISARNAAQIIANFPAIKRNKAASDES